MELITTEKPKYAWQKLMEMVPFGPPLPVALSSARAYRDAISRKIKLEYPGAVFESETKSIEVEKNGERVVEYYVEFRRLS